MAQLPDEKKNVIWWDVGQPIMPVEHARRALTWALEEHSIYIAKMSHAIKLSEMLVLLMRQTTDLFRQYPDM